ncbi:MULTISPECIES: flavodoxin domain-containing protein [Mameliella]|uniref:flavodoxin domain-containing protein n=1 Tax=Mameliella TaxID=1434019 RepID=UPI000B52B759|nr:MULTISPECIES: flavodoxin domain-containing protein [Mameliella]MBV6638276.1 flavodoxin domain-containing protein [Mameliella sp.]MCR9275675.1 flavodoxin domain-containing protein [Paracoccaceae bacterium]OWV54015.1 nitric oxide synthase [Mameliella alba]
MKITILYGTETGNAEMLAEDIQSEIEGDHEVEISNLEDFAPADFDADCFYLLVCSTYGDGDLPASAQPFADAMAAEKPDLAAIHFAIFGLGDSEYDETFNHGPKKLAELMIAHGAHQVGERVAHDASGSDMAEDLAFPWAQAVIAEVSEKLGEAA